MPERTAQCPDCGIRTPAPPPGARIKHHADGSHTFVVTTPPGATTDPKPRGRRYA